MLIDAEAFAGREDFSSLLSHLRFVRNCQERTKRVAALTGNSFLAILPKFADDFVAAGVRHFVCQDRDKALNRLHTGMTIP